MTDAINTTTETTETFNPSIEEISKMFWNHVQAQREKDMATRQCLLGMVDCIEKLHGISPTTAQIRRSHREKQE